VVGVISLPAQVVSSARHPDDTFFLFTQFYPAHKNQRYAQHARLFALVTCVQVCDEYLLDLDAFSFQNVVVFQITDFGVESVKNLVRSQAYDSSIIILINNLV
jgi:hypothetical protein